MDPTQDPVQSVIDMLSSPLQDEWSLLDEGQRLLYDHVSLQSMMLTSAAGDSDGNQGLEVAPVQAISADMPGLSFEDIYPTVDLQSISALMEPTIPLSEQALSSDGETLSRRPKKVTRKRRSRKNRGVAPRARERGEYMAERALSYGEGEEDFMDLLKPLIIHIGGRTRRRNKWRGSSARGEHDFNCTKCGKTFRHTHLTIKVRNVPPAERPNDSSAGGTGFRSGSALSKPLGNQAVRKSYKCSQCGKYFRHSSGLSVHRKVHSLEKNYECRQCGKGFSYKSSLAIHQRIHTGERPYECTLCGKFFRYVSNLITHRRIHTGERPHECNECGKGFIRKSQLRQHQSIHTGERPFECGECGKGFGSKVILVEHEKIHTGVRPFECGVCEKTFIRKSHLIQHQKVHSD